MAIARALGGSAPIILADEPTANLDSQVGTPGPGALPHLAEQESRALLIVTHDPRSARSPTAWLQIRDGVILN